MHAGRNRRFSDIAATSKEVADKIATVGAQVVGGRSRRGISRVMAGRRTNRYGRRGRPAGDGIDHDCAHHLTPAAVIVDPYTDEARCLRAELILDGA
jgi:hypothetical protein